MVEADLLCVLSASLPELSSVSEAATLDPYKPLMVYTLGGAGGGILDNFSSASASSMTLAASLDTTLEVVITESGLCSSGLMGNLSNDGRSSSELCAWDGSDAISALVDAFLLDKLEFFLLGDPAEDRCGGCGGGWGFLNPEP